RRLRCSALLDGPLLASRSPGLRRGSWLRGLLGRRGRRRRLRCLAALQAAHKARRESQPAPSSVLPSLVMPMVLFVVVLLVLVLFPLLLFGFKARRGVAAVFDQGAGVRVFGRGRKALTGIGDASDRLLGFSEATFDPCVVEVYGAGVFADQ